ncbi:MAG: ATP-binding cassette domain-containing protein [Bdellovibrionales bacterium]|nr:ATP-binding cassette domain-containing protein [Bdellovibrionales bacterium]
MNAIEVEHLYFSYGLAQTSISSILKDLSFTIRVGELVAIQGPSGSGKSTLLYALGLLSRPDSGLIRILGKDVSSCTEVELAKIEIGTLVLFSNSFTYCLKQVCLIIYCFQLATLTKKFRMGLIRSIGQRSTRNWLVWEIDCNPTPINCPVDSNKG